MSTAETTHTHADAPALLIEAADTIGSRSAERDNGDGERSMNLIDHQTAVKNAKRILKQGDRIRVSRCGGIKRTYTFDSWDGPWIVSKSGVDDIAAGHVDRLNGKPVDFARAAAL